MSSILTTAGDLTKVKGVFGKNFNTPIYMQFVPGVCVEPIVSTETLKSYDNSKNVNSILAIPHIRKGPKKKRTDCNDTDRYFPLFRGMVEVPAYGDPVLLCDFGGVKYYLGPLNTENNVNFNDDNMSEPEINLSSGNLSREQNEVLAKGESLNFKKINYKRMSKKWNSKLDETKAYKETHGDMIFEGRHGNSIRIGSRSENPYVFISNGRQPQFQQEGFSDGSLIAITNKGSLNQHFGGYYKQEKDDDLSNLLTVNGFTLASDNVTPSENPPNRLMSKLVSSVNGDVNANELIYNYGNIENQNQMLFHSDRITFNSKTDDIYLSSNKDIHIGTKRHLTISTAEDLIIESERIYLGDPNKKEMESMVLGDKLLKILDETLSALSEATSLFYGSALPLTDSTGKSPLSAKLSPIQKQLKQILSTKHKIEQG